MLVGGFAWLQQHRSSIEAAVQRNGARFRYVVPDVRDCDVLAQMVAASGVREEEIKAENDKVMNMVRCLNVKVDLHRVNRVPRYGMVMLGSRVVFFHIPCWKGARKTGRLLFLTAIRRLGSHFCVISMGCWIMRKKMVLPFSDSSCFTI